MEWQANSYTVLTLINTFIATGMAIYTWRQRPARGALYIALLMAAVAEWSLGYTLELGSPTLEAKIFWSNCNFLGIVSIPVLWFFFALQYTYHDPWLTPRAIGLTATPMIATLILAWTNPLHHLLRSSESLDFSSAIPMFNPVYSTGFWLFWMYTFMLLMASTILVLYAMLTSPNLYQGQGITLLVAAFIPWIGNVLYLSGLSPLGKLDLTPFAFLITGILTAWNISHYRLLDLVPVTASAVLASFNDAIVVLDNQRRIVDINRVAQTLLQHRPTAVIGQPAKLVLEHWQAIRIAEQTGAAEITLGERNAQRTFEVRITPIYNPQQQWLGQLIVYHDIDDRKRLEAAVKSNERKFRSVVEESYDGIAIILAGRVRYCNPQLARMLGYTPDEIQNRPFEEYIDPTVRDALLAHYQNGKRHIEGSHRYESILRHKNATLIDVEINASDIEYEDQLATLAFIRDITARKHAEVMLRQRTQELEIRNQELDAFAHTVAHDLKNPITLIIGYSSILEKRGDKLTTEELQGYLHILAQGGRKMDNIIDELLLLTSVRKIEDVPRIPLNMSDILSETQKRLTDMLDEYHAALVIPTEWPQAFGYPAWIEEVWVNYISNAIKYGGNPAASIPPHIELGYDSPGDGQIRFWVHDNGHGLTPEEQAQLFTLFTRLDTLRAKGHGLGLSIVRRIVEKLDGQVGIESHIGAGSRFWFTLPAYRPVDSIETR